MPYKLPTLPELIKTTDADLSIASNALRRSDQQVLSRVHSGTVYGLYGYLGYIAQQILPDTCDEDVLYRWAELRGVYRKKASRGFFTVKAVGQIGSIVPKGATYQSSSGQFYSVVADVPVASKDVLIRVQSDDVGMNNNLSAGEKLLLVSPVLGLESEAIVQDSEQVPAVDEETVEDFRARLIAGFKLMPHGGAVGDYEMWAMECAPVHRAWAVANYMGAGTVGVFVVGENQENILTEQTAREIQDYVQSKAPITAEVYVLAAKPVEVKYKLKIEPDTDAVRSRIEHSLIKLHDREAGLGSKLLLTHIAEAISTSIGEHDHSIYEPLADVDCPKNSILVFGGIEWIT